MTSKISETTIAHMSPEPGKKLGQDDSIEEFIKDIRYTPEGRLRWERKRLRNRARYRLDQMLDQSYDKGTERFMAHKILITHGFIREEIQALEYSTAHRLAVRLIASDLLITEFYDAEGNLTDFAKDNYPNVDPKDYIAIPTEWTATQKILEDQVGVNQKGKNNIYAGHISSQTEELDEDDGDIVARYARIFGKENVVALPFTVGVDSCSFYISHQGNFVPPYGGSAPRLVFLSRVTTLRLPSLE